MFEKPIQKKSVEPVVKGYGANSASFQEQLQLGLRSLPKQVGDLKNTPSESCQNRLEGKTSSLFENAWAGPRMPAHG